MSIKRVISIEGFLLIEVMIAFTFLAVMVVPVASYIWFNALQIVRAEKQIRLLLSMRDYYERDIMGDLKSEQDCPAFVGAFAPPYTTTIICQELPLLMIDDVPLRPVRYEGTYAIGGTVNTYYFISVRKACN